MRSGRPAVALVVAGLLSLPARAAELPAAGLVPEQASAALLAEGPAALAGLRELLAAASRSAPSLRPDLLGQDLARALALDPLAAEQPLFGPGPVALVGEARTLGLSVPVADLQAARKRVEQWLGQLGPPRTTRGQLGLLSSGSGHGERAAWLFSAHGAARLCTASGTGAVQLVRRLAQAARGPSGRGLAAELQGRGAGRVLQAPLVLWVRGMAPVSGLVAQVEASAALLRLQGLLLEAPPRSASTGGALVEGESPPASACDGEPLLCVRAAPGPLLRALFERAARSLTSSATSESDPLAGAGRLLSALLPAARGGALLRLSSFDPQRLGRTLPELLAAFDLQAFTAARTSDEVGRELAALPGAEPAGSRLPGLSACVGQGEGTLWLSSPCRAVAQVALGGGPSELELRLDTRLLARSFAGLSPLDALGGGPTSLLVGFKLLWAGLLARGGPLQLWLRPPAQDASPGALEVELRWPLFAEPPAQ